MTSSGDPSFIDPASLLDPLAGGLLDHLPAIVYVLDETGRFAKWNRRLEEILESPAADLVKLGPVDLIVPEEAGGMAKHLDEVRRAGEGRVEATIGSEPESAVIGHFSHRMVEAKGSRWIVGLVVELPGRRIPPEPRAGKFDAAILELGQRLSEARSPREAGRVIADVSRNLIGWDACSITLQDPETGGVRPVFTMDTVEGKLTEFPGTVPAGAPPSPAFAEILRDGSRLILRNEGSFSDTSIPFGNTGRRSQSLIFVPIRKGDRSVGVMSIQSYRKEAYTEHDVRTLEALAGHCAGALERLRIEGALRLAEQRFIRAFETSPVAMFVGDYENGRALAVNSAFVQIFGFSRDELLGRNGLEIGFWDNPADREEIYRAIRSGRPVRDVQVRFRSKAGELRHVLVSVETIQVEGERSLLFFNYDITERVKLEARLRQSQKLESIGQVTAGVAHDFNNLLTVVDGCTSLALASNYLDPEVRELLDQIAQAAERAGNLTRQLLAFSSRQEMVARELDLNAVVRNLARMLERILGPERSLDLRCGNCLPTVSADPGMIEQVIVNMVVNARDAMPDGGNIVIETAVVAPDPATLPPDGPAVAADSYICLRVTDTGGGISPGNLPRLFEPFFTTKEVGKGNGLGLATAYGIVKQHHGWIDVRSRIAEGSTFSVYLPACGDAPAVEDSTGPAYGAPKGKESILVVEDEPSVRELICHILTFYGYTSIAAESGVKALQVWAARAAEIDGVITDIVMPGGIDGRELAERLLADRPDLPILYISGYSPDIAGQRIDLIDGVNFLQKPFEAASLAKALRARLDGRE